MYTKHKDCKQFIRWKCVKSSSFKCPAVLKVLSIHHEHNHAADQNNIEAVKSKAEIKEIAKFSGSTPGQIFNEVINKIPKQALMKIPTEESIKRTIQMQRSGNNPVEPTDINDLIIEGEWSLWNSQSFLLYDNKSENTNERIIMFGTDNMIHLLSQSKEWYMEESLISS
ncbi:unnamed protein product [Macrosiphum euphorbiae]|uniref:FLYWCH-type domain-containing protein n=1 Tax=Macrosiphum euphorbiae TaxID=13131 RepID=A0AAV0Y9R0_9HEMI|nr:unnamed protein product [Macrosiphum euphorbiae]